MPCFPVPDMLAMWNESRPRDNFNDWYWDQDTKYMFLGIWFEEREFPKWFIRRVQTSGVRSLMIYCCQSSQYRTVTRLFALPDSLRHLSVDRVHQLAALPRLPPHLDQLAVESTSITRLPALPARMSMLWLECNLDFNYLPTLPEMIPATEDPFGLNGFSVEIDPPGARQLWRDGHNIRVRKYGFWTYEPAALQNLRRHKAAVAIQRWWYHMRPIRA